MRKLLAIFVFALMTEAITAQPYTFHGKQYDWKWEAPEYTFVPVMGEEDAATLGVELTSMIKAVSSSQIKSPLTLYLSKQGDVTMTVKKGNCGFRAVKSSLLLNGISGLQLQAETVSEGNICIYRKGRITAVIKGYGEVYIEGFADRNKQVIQWFKDHPDALNTTASVQSQEESRPQEEITDEDITGDDGTEIFRGEHGSIFNNPVTLNIRKGNTLEIIYGSNKQKVKIALPPPTTRYSYDVFDDLYY